MSKVTNRSLGLVVIVLAILLVLATYGRDLRAKRKEGPDITYVGDVSKVVAIVDDQEYPKGYTYDHIEIQSGEEPYELTIYFQVDEEADMDQEAFNENVDYTLASIGNLEYLRYVNVETGEDIIRAFKTKP